SSPATWMNRISFSRSPRFCRRTLRISTSWWTHSSADVSLLRSGSSGMKLSQFGLGALLILWAAPSFSQHTPSAADPLVRREGIDWFQLTESPEEIRVQLGPPVMIVPFGLDFVSWYYQFEQMEEQEYSLQLVFRKSEGRLISVTRNYDPERHVDALFHG